MFGQVYLANSDDDRNIVDGLRLCQNGFITWQGLSPNYYQPDDSDKNSVVNNILVFILLILLTRSSRFLDKLPFPSKAIKGTLNIIILATQWIKTKLIFTVLSHKPT